MMVFRSRRFSTLLIDKRSYLVCSRFGALGNFKYEWASSSMPADGPKPGEKSISIPFGVLSDEIQSSEFSSVPLALSITSGWPMKL